MLKNRAKTGVFRCDLRPIRTRGEVDPDGRKHLTRRLFSSLQQAAGIARTTRAVSRRAPL
jgi:hypothetical protein